MTTKGRGGDDVREIFLLQKKGEQGNKKKKTAN